jgi:hypothetical protein
MFCSTIKIWFQGVCLKMTSNGRVYETFGILKRFTVKIQQILIRAIPLDNPLIAKCFIYDVMHIPLSIHILFQKLLNLNPGIIGIHDIVSPNVLGYSLSR